MFKKDAGTNADEADMLNVALFGKTAKEWKNENKGKKGNIRDFATLKQLLVLANMESYNALLINNNEPQEQRIIKLRDLVIKQMNVLEKLNTEKLNNLEQK